MPSRSVPTRAELPTERPSRAVVEPVRPVTPGGFPAKGACGEPLTVVADVFTDGHDFVGTALDNGAAAKHGCCAKGAHHRMV